MKESYKLYVWENVLYDNKDGMMIAIAENVEEAREMLLKECNYIPDFDIKKRPKIIRSKKAFVIWG